jgi:hypothetical protein
LCQFGLIQLLDWFAGRDLSRTGLTWIDDTCALSRRERGLLEVSRKSRAPAVCARVAGETLAWDKLHYGNLLLYGLLRSPVRLHGRQCRWRWDRKTGRLTA